MDEPRTPSWLPLRTLLIAGTVVFPFLSGCGSGAKQAPAPLPPVSELSQKPPESKQKAEEPVAQPTHPDTLVIVDPGVSDDDAKPKTLAEAAAAEKNRRAAAGKPVVSLDNKNIAVFGRNQKLTVAEPGPASEETASAAKDGAAATDRESTWRERGLEIRRKWRAAVDRIAELESHSEELKRRFYATDDPYLRDNQIKPEWDRTLADLDRARREAEEAPRELERFLDEGRRAGALPGWLREGVELEPETPTSPSESGAAPAEPLEAPEPVASEPPTR